MKKKLAIIGTVALLGVGAVALSSPEWRANTIFATARDKQLAWLKEHEKQIVAWVHSEYPKIETIQFDWNTLKVIPVSVGFTIEGYNLSVRGTFNDIPETKITIDFSLEKESDLPNMRHIFTNNKPGIIRSGVLYNYE
jgi:lipoprotein